MRKALLPDLGAIPPFNRAFWNPADTFTRIGDGAVGGKAAGLLFIKDVLAEHAGPGAFRHASVRVPILTVLTTDVFDRFMTQNRLYPVALSGVPDERVAHAFQCGDLPADLVGDLRALVQQVHTPLAVRSSSLLEDALLHPFAGVYATKMIPNNQPDADTRFRRLVEAVKFVYASTYFAGARNYLKAIGRDETDEKMAVIIQEVVGGRRGDRFYPNVSGVARSYSFYRSGATRPEEGVVNLALGLGKTIVDGGSAWTYSPAHPHATPPFGSVRDLLRQTQVDFWAVNMGRPPEYDPTKETEYLVRGTLADAEADGVLEPLVSTYDPQSDRLAIGLRRFGARVLTFAPLLVLDDYPVNAVVRRLLDVCEEALSAPVEIEFAMTLDPDAETTVHLGFVQVRPMVVSNEAVEIDETDFESGDLLVASESVMGNGIVDSIADVVYVKPETFEARHTPVIARELAALNTRLLESRRPYLLIGFGRWGSSDPWLGIPVEWSQINGARAIVEATLPAMMVDPSQGAHFFHNISSFEVTYFCVRPADQPGIAWDWLRGQRTEEESEYVRRVRLDAPLLVKVDGRRGVGVIRYRA